MLANERAQINFTGRRQTYTNTDIATTRVSEKTFEKEENLRKKIVSIFTYIYPNTLLCAIMATINTTVAGS